VSVAYIFHFLDQQHPQQHQQQQQQQQQKVTELVGFRQ
jgi:hypothetical protein